MAGGSAAVGTPTWTADTSRALLPSTGTRGSRESSGRAGGGVTTPWRTAWWWSPPLLYRASHEAAGGSGVDSKLFFLLLGARLRRFPFCPVVYVWEDLIPGSHLERVPGSSREPEREPLKQWKVERRPADMRGPPSKPQPVCCGRNNLKQVTIYHLFCQLWFLKVSTVPSGTAGALFPIPQSRHHGLNPKVAWGELFNASSVDQMQIEVIQTLGFAPKGIM